jgi:hypothetical protein
MSQVFQVQLESGDEGPLVVKTAVDPDGIDRLKREAERLLRGRHPGVVEVVSHTPGRLELRWVGSHTLETARPTVPAAAAILAALAVTVADVHGLGVVHGRIDPSHVVIGPRGEPVLCGLRGPDPGCPEPGPAEDVAAIGRLIDHLLGPEADPEPIPDRRWGRRPWSGYHRRTLQLLADRAVHEDPARRPTARALANAIMEAVPEARLVTPADPVAAPPGPPADSSPQEFDLLNSASTPDHSTPSGQVRSKANIGSDTSHELPRLGKAPPASDTKKPKPARAVVEPLDGQAGSGTVAHGIDVDRGATNSPMPEDLAEHAAGPDPLRAGPFLPPTPTTSISTSRLLPTGDDPSTVVDLPIPDVAHGPDRSPGPTPSPSRPDTRSPEVRTILGLRLEPQDAPVAPAGTDRGGEPPTTRSGNQPADCQPSSPIATPDRDAGSSPVGILTRSAGPGTWRRMPMAAAAVLVVVVVAAGGARLVGQTPATIGPSGARSTLATPSLDTGRASGAGEGQRSEGLGAEGRRSEIGASGDATPVERADRAEPSDPTVSQPGDTTNPDAAVGHDQRSPSGTTATSGGSTSSPSPTDPTRGAAVSDPSGARYQVGEPGDEVAVGDWDCDGTPTPGVVRAATGEVFLFDRWAEAGEPVTVAAAVVMPGVDRLEPPDHTCPGYLLMADGARAALVRTAGGWTTEMVR